MNILAIDYGQKRIGMAWCQTDLDVVLPFGVIAYTDKQQAIQSLITCIQTEKIDHLVVGLPIGVDDHSDTNTNSIRVKTFIQELTTKHPISVSFVDERFSSKQADSMGGNVSRDEKAAMVILETYRTMQ